VVEVRLRRPFILFLPALVAVAGCGSDDGGGKDSGKAASSKPAAAANRVAVAETDYRLTPSNPKVKKGTVTFAVTNRGKTVHSLEVEGPGGEQQLAEPLKPGESGTLKAKLGKDGKYEWYCPIDNHKGLGMKGEITVGGGGSGQSSSSGNGGGGSSYGY
jgi:plastocyanin